MARFTVHYYYYQPKRRKSPRFNFWGSIEGFTESGDKEDGKSSDFAKYLKAFQLVTCSTL